MFQLDISCSGARAIYKRQDEYKRRAAASEDLSSCRARRSYFEQVSQGLWDWYQTLRRLGARHVSVSGGLLEARARRIGTELGVTGFKASRHFIQNWARRYKLRNIALWGQGASADIAGSTGRVSEIRKELEVYPPDRIYNMDETGLFYRCTPNRSYVQAGQRRQARGTKAMKAKDRVTLVWAYNATDSHKIPVAFIGKAKQPRCFKPPRQACPVPYFSQNNAWMDGVIFKSWFETVFLRSVRARVTLPVALVPGNCGAHEELASEQVKFIALPPNCTSIYQPLDMGIIACLKRRYKWRLLDLVVGAFDSMGGTGASQDPVVGANAGAANAAVVPVAGEVSRAATGRVASVPVAPASAGADHVAPLAPASVERAAEEPLVLETGPASAIVAGATGGGGVTAAAGTGSTTQGHGSGPAHESNDASGSLPVAAGPGIWGWASDSLTASNSRPPPGPRSLNSAQAVIRDVRDGSTARLQDASQIVKGE
eukprot:contig_16886_g4102